VTTLRLHPADLEQIADLVADRLAQRLGSSSPTPALVDVKALASLLGVSTDYVYEHARELGGLKLGDGPRAPWRFDVQAARDAMASRSPESPSPPPRRRRRRRPAKTPSGVPLLAIRGEEP
jgi:hypothetical protein